MAIGGDTFEQTVSMGAAMSEIINDASVAGQTLKTVGLRLRGAKAELEETGESTEGMANSVSKLRGQIMALTKVNGNGGIDIMKNANEYKSLYDVLNEISQIWDNLVQLDQSALVELLAGGANCQKDMETYFYRTHFFAFVA